jgi:hypothetical protein
MRACHHKFSPKRKGRSSFPFSLGLGPALGPFDGHGGELPRGILVAMGIELEGGFNGREPQVLGKVPFSAFRSPRRKEMSRDYQPCIWGTS